MAFTYDISSADANEKIVSQIRLEVGDTSQERGVKPEGGNYTDEELLHIYEVEGESIGRAAARICEQLANAWSSVPRTMFGSLFDPRHVGRNYMRQAATLRSQYGYFETESTSFSISVRTK